MKSGYKKSTMAFAMVGLLLAVLPVSAQDVLIKTESELRAFANNVNNGTDYRGQTTLSGIPYDDVYLDFRTK